MLEDIKRRQRGNKISEFVISHDQNIHHFTLSSSNSGKIIPILFQGHIISIFQWDPYSDQPYQIKDRAFKKAERKKELFSLIYTFVSSFFILPLALFFLPLFRKNQSDTAHFFGMSVNLDKEPQITPELINELGVRHLLVRFSLGDMDKIEKYLIFIKSLNCDSVLLNVMQEPQSIKESGLLEKQFRLLFEKFSPCVTQFQIGTTINRSKWGFFSVGQYLRFYEAAYKVKKEHFPGLKLLGPSVIDFEYHYVVHALFNFCRVKYDALSALLYVDRRGAPENTQMGMDLVSKIHLLYALATLSPKSSNEIVITETNWPLKGTAPYAPTSEHECVDEEHYANYMVRYYLLALGSGMVSSVYWHQLISPGYGLVDNRAGNILKRPAYYAFKTMLKQLQGAQILSFTRHKAFYEMLAEQKGETVRVLWCNDTSFMLHFENEVSVISRDGKASQSRSVQLSGSPLYIKEPDA
jgi:hypothetical protein